MWLRLFNKIPSLRLVIPYIAGILLAEKGEELVYSSVLLSLWCLFSYQFLFRKLESIWQLRWLNGMAFAFLWFAIGCIAGLHVLSKSAFPENNGMKVVAEVRIKKKPVKKKKSWQIYAEIVKANPDCVNGKLIIFYFQQCENIDSINAGDRLVIRFTPQKPKINTSDLSFDYNKFLKRKGVCATAYVTTSDWKYLKAPENSDLTARAEIISGKIVNIFEDCGLTGNNLGLASAMSIGYRSDIDKNVESYFRAAGITHVLSVSGLHVGVIYSLICFILYFLKYGKVKKVIRHLIIIICLWIYAYIAGLCPSVCRSALMLSMVSIGDCFGRRSQTLNTVIFSAFILLLVNPLNIYDIGFQLSYLAVLGIVILYPILRNLIELKSSVLKYIRDLVLISFVAQLATFPLTMHYFGQFPNYFLLANLYAVPLSGLLIFVSAGCIVFHNITIIGDIFSRILEILTALFIKISALIGSLPFSVSDNISINVFQVVVIYLLIYYIYGLLIIKKRVYSWGIFISIVFLQISVIYNQLTNAS
jgi:competence protein ComEC